MGFAYIKNIMAINNNTNLNQITFGNSSQYINSFQANNCNLNTLNINGLTGLNSFLSVSANTNLTSVYFPKNNFAPVSGGRVVRSGLSWKIRELLRL